MRTQMTQGEKVGATIGVVSLIVAILAWQWPVTPPPVPAPTANEIRSPSSDPLVEKTTESPVIAKAEPPKGITTSPSPPTSAPPSAPSPPGSRSAATLSDIVLLRARSPRTDASGLTDSVIAALPSQLSIAGFDKLQPRSVPVDIWFDENVEGRNSPGWIWGTWNIAIAGQPACAVKQHQDKYGSSMSGVETAKRQAVQTGLKVAKEYLTSNVTQDGVICAR